MTARTYNLMTIGSMAAFVAGAFVVGSIFPGIPGYAYLVAALCFGLILLFAGRKIVKDSKLILSDERTERNSQIAAAMTHRVMQFAGMAFIVGVNIIPGIGHDWIVASRALIVVVIFQAYFFLIVRAIVDRRA